MKSKNQTFIFTSKKNGFSAKMVVDDGTFILKAGSTVNANVSEHFKSFKTVLKRRTEAGIDADNLMLTKDIVFTSPSVAGEFVCGSSCNGPSVWKTEEGVTYKNWRDR